mgnify:FL=1
MRIARVLGSVTLNRCLPSFESASLRLAVPMMTTDLESDQLPETETLVIWDELGAGNGGLVAVSEGAEAAQAFKPELKPVDAYGAALIDSVDLETS